MTARSGEARREVESEREERLEYDVQDALKHAAAEASADHNVCEQHLAMKDMVIASGLDLAKTLEQENVTYRRAIDEARRILMTNPDNELAALNALNAAVNEVDSASSPWRDTPHPSPKEEP